MYSIIIISKKLTILLLQLLHEVSVDLLVGDGGLQGDEAVLVLWNDRDLEEEQVGSLKGVFVDVIGALVE